MKKVLLKDIVIPKGTVFTESPEITERCGDGHVCASFGISKNTAGCIEYFISDFEEELEDWFTDLKE